MLEAADIDVAVVSPQRRASGAYLANIFLETVAPRHLPSARTNIIVPNPEWWNQAWNSVLRWPHVVVFAKTRDTERIFSQFDIRVVQVGFTSDDRYRGVVNKERRFLHVAGKSCQKGTDVVLQLWARRPDLPLLTVVDGLRRYERLGARSNVHIVSKRLDDEELATLQNRSLIHLCPSEYEGYGHTLWEAASCGAVCITTGAEPMVEALPPNGGFLVPPSRTGTRALATTQLVTSKDVERVVDDALSRSDDELKAMGATARRWWERKDRIARESWANAWFDATATQRVPDGRCFDAPVIRNDTLWTSPRELLAACERGSLPRCGAVPRVVHHIFGLWESGEHLPPAFERAARTWHDHHPGWQCVLWRSEDIDREVGRAGAAIADAYRVARRGAQRADLARYLVLLRYGGIYADLDVDCSHSLDGLVKLHEKAEAVLFVETVLTRERARSIGRREAIRGGTPELQRRIANYVMIAVPGAQILAAIVDLAARRVARVAVSEYDVIYTTGPDVVTEVAHRREFNDSVLILPRHVGAQYFRHRAEGSWRNGRDVPAAKRLERQSG